MINRLQYWLTPVLDRLPSSLFPEPSRQVLAYCVGTARSGTVSLYETFKDNYVAAHEPESRFLTGSIMGYLEGRLERDQLSRYLRQRDRRLGLEMESSYINFEIVDLLVELSPRTKFILTIRDVRSWLDSFVNLLLNKPEFLTYRKGYTLRHMNFRLGGDSFQFSEHDRVLRDIGLFPLESFLSYWTFHNTRVLTLVPDDRLLIVRTQDIGSCSSQMEKFLSLPGGSLKTSVRANPAIARHSVLDKIDQQFLREKIDDHCGELMRRFFPNETAS